MRISLSPFLHNQRNKRFGRGGGGGKCLACVFVFTSVTPAQEHFPSGPSHSHTPTTRGLPLSCAQLRLAGSGPVKNFTTVASRCAPQQCQLPWIVGKKQSMEGHRSQRAEESRDESRMPSPTSLAWINVPLSREKISIILCNMALPFYFVVNTNKPAHFFFSFFSSDFVSCVNHHLCFDLNLPITLHHDHDLSSPSFHL